MSWESWENDSNHSAHTVTDPVLPDQAGRMTQVDPGYVIPTSEEDIRRRAYAIYESRGRSDGQALDDWLTAESSVK
jgi:hypothetical protein